MNKTILITASILGATGIIFGAFGAHALKELIPIESQQTFETGVRYQMYHAFMLLFLGSVTFIRQKAKKVMYYLTLIGIVLFSGSIYGLATNTLSTLDFKFIGFLTPIGGSFLILTWFLLFVNLIKIAPKNED